MLNGLNEIINTVGGSKRKLTTLLILLAFVGGFYVFRTIIFKNDCSNLIEQNQKLISKNVDVVNVNNKLMDNNNLLLTKIIKMEELLANKDTVFIRVPIRVGNVRNTEDYIDAPKPVQLNMKSSSVIDTVSVTMTLDSNYIESDSIVFIESDSTKNDTIVKKVGFFKKIFGKK